MEEDAVQVERGGGLVLVAQADEAELGQDTTGQHGAARPDVQVRCAHRAVQERHDVLGVATLRQVAHVSTRHSTARRAQVLAVGVARLDQVEVGDGLVLLR